jgi:PPM family protein phosphatase
MSNLRTGSATNQGRIRPSNQDRFLISPHLAAIADGMGGHNGGEVAAGTAIDALLRNFGSKRSSEELLAAVETANKAIWERSRDSSDLRGMGTTLTAVALVVDGGVEQMTLVNVGDSRAYLYAEETLSLLTADHSLVEEMVRSGELTPEEAQIHPHRHILTRALGIEADVEVDAWRFEPIDGDRVLLCSDGLTNELTEDEIGDVLAGEEEPDAAAEELVRLAVAHGGNDNVTAVVVDVTNEHRPVKQAAAAPKSTPAKRKSKPRPPSQDGDATAGHTEGLTQAVPIVTADAETPEPPAAAPPLEQAERDGTEGAAGNGAGELRGRSSRRSGNSSGKSDPADSGPPTRAMASDEFPSTTMVPSLQHAEPAEHAEPADPGVAQAPASPRPRRSAREGNGRSPAVDLDEVPHGSRPVMLVAGRGPSHRSRGERIITARVVLFAILLLGLLGGVVGVVGWYVENAYYVGLSKGEVVVYHGRIGGLLWFQPSVVDRTTISVKQIIPPLVPTLRNGVQETTLQEAEDYVSVLKKDQGLLPLFSTTTTVPASTIPAQIGTTTTVSPVPATTPATFPPTTNSLPPSTSTPSTPTTTTVPKSTTTTLATTTTAPTTTTPGGGKHHHGHG